MDAAQLERLSAALTGRYTLERELGRGGMATVWLAQDLKHDRPVALKVLRPELAAVLGPERFLREVRITARLNHPHILPLLDSGEVDGFLYYVMPYVAGESLRYRLDREKQLPLDHALQIAREVADALSYAHSHDVVHRDVKPDNILLESGHAVVADFGVARAISAAGGEALTQTGVAVGTPTYMSPEQAAGGEVDARTDVYALGCVLFEMLAGQTPFTGTTTPEVVAKAFTEDPPPVSSYRPESPIVLDQLVRRARARDPAKRYATAGELGAALGAAMGGTGTFPSGVTRRRRRRAVVAALVGVALIAGWLALRPRPPAVPVVGRTSRVTSDAGAELDPAISPDGRLVAYAAGPIGRMRILVRQLGQGSAVSLTDGLGGNHRWPRWSPDGQRVVFLAAADSGAGVYVIPALGGPAKRVAEFPRGVEVYGVDWSPDGRRLAYVADRVIAVRSVEGGPARTVAKARDPHSVSWSPDGSHLAFTDGNASFVFGAAVLGNVSPTSIRVVPVAGGAPVAITDSAVLSVSPVWDPHGRGLFFVSSRGGARDIWFQPLDAARRPRGEPAQLTAGLQAHNVTVSGDGRRLLYSALSLQANIWRVPIPAPGRVATAAEATQVTTGSQAIEGLSVSRDGRWLAFDSDRSGNQDIYRIPATGGTAERLTDDPADDFIPVWSPDGRKIAFYSFRTGNRDVFVMAADGGGVEQVTREASHERVPDWSPDGRSLVFFSDRTGRPELFVVTRTAEGGGWEPARQLTRDGAGNSRWSPRGAEIAYGGGFSVRVIPAEGGASRVVVAAADPGQDPAPHWIEWSPDGRTIYFKTLGPQGRSAIFAVPVQGGAPRPVLVFPDPARQSPRTEFAVGPGYLYFTMGHHEGDIWALELPR